MGSTLSTSRLVARRRRKTTSAANVDYCHLNVTTSRHKSSVAVPRFLSVLTGRKAVAVARQPDGGDVISGDDAQCQHKHNNDSGYDEDMSGVTVHSVTKFDLQQDNVKVTKGCEDRSRPKKTGRMGPFRHWTVHSIFGRTASVGPMVDRIVTAVAYKHKDNKESDVKVKDKVNVNVKVAERSSTALLRCDKVRPSRLLCCLDEFVHRRCHSSLAVSECFRSVDRDLLTSGWHEASFINDTTTIFVYALLSRCVDEYGQLSADELRTLVYVCLYMSYTYIGPEISYPLRPFIRDCCDQTTTASENPHRDDDDSDDDVDDEDVVIEHVCSTTHSLSSSSDDSDDLMDDCRQRFWTCCMFLVERCSRLMLRLNSDSELYARIYRQLTRYSPTSVSREP